MSEKCGSFVPVDDRHDVVVRFDPTDAVAENDPREIVSLVVLQRVFADIVGEETTLTRSPRNNRTSVNRNLGVEGLHHHHALVYGE